MGMYTELHYNARLKSDVDVRVIATLNVMLDHRLEITELPDHPLFATPRWRHMLTCDSYSFAADTHSTLRHDSISDQWVLCIRCNLKNYDDEIEKFCDWIRPSIDAEEGEFLGFSRYEETETPTLIYA